MKNIILLLSFVLATKWSIFAKGLETNDWGIAANNVQIGIGMKNGEAQVKTNQPLRLLIRIKNLSTNVFLVYCPNRLIQGNPYWFEITSPSGKDLTPKSQIAAGSGNVVNLRPNQIYQDYFDFNMSNFNELGTYKIAFEMPSDISGDKAISNPLYLTVVPGKWEPTNAP